MAKAKYVVVRVPQLEGQLTAGVKKRATVGKARKQAEREIAGEILLQS